MEISPRKGHRIPWSSPWLIAVVAAAVVLIAGTLGIGLANGLFRPTSQFVPAVSSPSQTPSGDITPVASPMPSATPTQSAVPAQSAMPTESATPPPSPTPPVASCSTPAAANAALDAQPTVSGIAGGAVLVTQGQWPDATKTRMLRLVSVEGTVIATVSAAPHSLIACDVPYDSIGETYQRVTVSLPWISTSASRVYFLDGDSEIRFLALDGTYGRAATLPTGPTTGAVFSVSPDDTRVAVALFDYTVWPVGETIYIEDLGGGDRILAGGLDAYYWPVGWHDGRVVLESQRGDFGYLGTGAFAFYSPRGAPDGYRLLDPATGAMAPRLGDPDCAIDGSLPSQAGLACGMDGAIYGAGWDGTITRYMDGAFTGGGALAPDGSRMAACCYDGPRIGLATPGGELQLTAAKGYVGDGGWLDSTHVVYRIAGTSDFAILDVSTGVIAEPISLAGQLIVDRIPAGL